MIAPQPLPESGFWSTFLADARVPVELKVQALERGALAHPDAQAPGGAIDWVLRAAARAWADESNARGRQHGFRSLVVPDALAWRQGYDPEGATRRDRAVRPLIQALLDAGAVPTTPSVEMALRLELPGCLALQLAHPRAPAVETLASLRTAPGGRDWVAWAAGHRLRALLEVLLAHGFKPTHQALAAARTLDHARCLVESGLSLADPDVCAATGLAWSQSSCMAVEEPSPQPPLGWLGASAQALLGARRHPVAGSVAALHRLALSWSHAQRDRFGAHPWDARAWTQPEGGWKGRWSLPATYARQALLDRPTVGSPYLLLAWMVACPPRWERLSSVAGLPDRGWWALAMLHHLASASPHTPQAHVRQIDAWARQTLAVRSWADPGLLAQALEVTRWLAGTRRSRRPALARAWAGWLAGDSRPDHRRQEQTLWVLEALAEPRLGLQITPTTLVSVLRKEASKPVPTPAHLARRHRLGLATLALLAPHRDVPRSTVEEMVGLCWKKSAQCAGADSPPAVQGAALDVLQHANHPLAHLVRARLLSGSLEERLSPADPQARSARL